MDKCGVVYEVSCAMCNKVYVGETGRRLNKRIEEHKKDLQKNTNRGATTRAARLASCDEEHSSAITDHMLQANHLPNWDDVKVLSNESIRLDRQIREAIHIRTRDTVNRDEGAYQLSHVYDDILRKPRPPSLKGGAGQVQSH